MLESEIEHGITTIVADESARMSAAGISSGSSSGSDPASDSPGRSTIASGSLKALAGLPGTTAPLLGELAASIDETLPHLAESEKAIRDRSWIMTFFFGGDDSAAGDIEMHVSEDMDSLDKMDQILNDPSTSPAIRTFTRERETIIRSDLLRLQSLAVTEKMKKGLFG